MVGQERQGWADADGEGGVSERDRSLITDLHDAQRRFNDLQAQIRYKPLLQYIPESRWRKMRRRVTYRWERVRIRVALWIAPELDEY